MTRLRVPQPYPGKVVLSWSAGNDTEAVSSGLSYNLRVGSTPGGVDILSPLSDPATGRRRAAQSGNAQRPLFTVLNLPTGTVGYWSAQTVDASYLRYALQVSTNLVNWTVLTDLTAGANGALQFLDRSPAAPARLDRVSY